MGNVYTLCAKRFMGTEKVSVAVMLQTSIPVVPSHNEFRVTCYANLKVFS